MSHQFWDASKNASGISYQCFCTAPGKLLSVGVSQYAAALQNWSLMSLPMSRPSNGFLGVDFPSVDVFLYMGYNGTWDFMGYMIYRLYIANYSFFSIINDGSKAITYHMTGGIKWNKHPLTKWFSDFLHRMMMSTQRRGAVSLDLLPTDLGYGSRPGGARASTCRKLAGRS